MEFSASLGAIVGEGIVWPEVGIALDRTADMTLGAEDCEARLRRAPLARNTSRPEPHYCMGQFHWLGKFDLLF